MSPSPGPTFTMPARSVRPGDVMYLDAETPMAIVAVMWDGRPPSLVMLTFDDGTTYDANPNAQLDVTRPFDRHAETGEHDTP